MLTRRGFAGCAICALTGVIATDASAQAAAPVATTGYTRKILSQMDGPTPGYVTILVEAELQAGGTIARHTHPGIESTYILEGSVEIPIPRSTDPFI
jgi:quercetin dioxygenase-like cupin family protein